MSYLSVGGSSDFIEIAGRRIYDKGNLVVLNANSAGGVGSRYDSPRNLEGGFYTVPAGKKLLILGINLQCIAGGSGLYKSIVSIGYGDNGVIDTLTPPTNLVISVPLARNTQHGAAVDYPRTAVLCDYTVPAGKIPCFSTNGDYGGRVFMVCLLEDA